MSDSKYPNSGSLNPTREKRSDRSPDWWGRLEISGDVLEAINQGKPIRLSGWMRDGNYGEFISLKVSVEQPRQETSQPSDAGAGKQWPAAAPGQAQPRARTGTIEGNLALKGMDPDAPFDDDIPF